MKSNESVAYLKGVFEGLGMDSSSAEGKLFVALMDTVQTLSEEVADLQARLQDLGEYVEELDEDLAYVEEDLYDIDDEDEDYDDEDDDTQYFEVVCPSCGEVVCFDDSLEEDEITCPSCGELLELDFECDGQCGEDCCGCPAAEQE